MTGPIGVHYARLSIMLYNNNNYGDIIVIVIMTLLLLLLLLQRCLELHSGMYISCISRNIIIPNKKGTVVKGKIKTRTISHRIYYHTKGFHCPPTSTHHLPLLIKVMVIVMIVM